VSDADFKERCDNGSCCGLAPEWGYTRGQTTEALQIAKERGVVHWGEIAPDLEYARTFQWYKAVGFNTNSSETRAKYDGFTMYDYLRYLWNHPQEGKSPYRMFGGVLTPEETLDAAGDVVYRYTPEAA
jgi:hypothetical protein